jgi:type 2 lantibiotic biosynthesis protein LanM
VGDRLEALALRGDDGEVTWIGLTQARAGRWSLLPLGADLYGGLPGVALFLAYLGEVSGEERYAALAGEALAALRRQAERLRPSVTLVGAFDGWGGVIYALTHLGALWGRPELLQEAAALAEPLPGLIERDDLLDVISGSAGCLAALLALDRAAPSRDVLAAATCCGERLLAAARPAGDGLAWVTPLPASAPLTGFSHGAAGMAWSLLELAARTGEARYRTAARAAFAYERGLFAPAPGNWPDFRDLAGTGGDRPPAFMTAWCHGAPGIGLARLRALRHSDDEVLRAEIGAALRATRRAGFGGNLSLCHGDLGNLELFLQASEILGESRWRSEADRVAGATLRGIERDGWVCGVPGGVESPGLMTGLAGIGYGLLRLAEPGRVPPVLVLAPPAPG